MKTQQTITIVLPPDMQPALEAIRQQAGLSWNDLAAEALREYLFLRQFRTLREQMTPRAQAQGILTDEDVFERVS